MDPEECLLRAARALASGEIDDASDALQDYPNWRRNGGFQPKGGDARAERIRRAFGRRVSGKEVSAEDLAKMIGDY